MPRRGCIATANRPGRVALALTLALIAGCTVYAPEPRSYAIAPPSTTVDFDRSWAAVVGALGDEDVRIAHEDRDAGRIIGSRDGIDVTANIRTRPDGGVRVEFNTAGSTGRDPKLIERISRAYDRRMGR